MSIRQEILAALADGGKTMNELLDAIPGEERSKLNDNTAQAIKDGLIEKNRSDEQGRAFEYHLTDSGKARLDAGERKLIKPRKPVAKPAVKKATPKDGNGDDMPPADAALLAKANKMLTEKLKEAEDALKEDEETLASVTADSIKIIKQRDAWRAVADDLSLETPNDLRRYINDILSERRRPVSDSAQKAPLFWLAFSSASGSSIHCNSEQDAREHSELLALADGIGYVCAVMAECTSAVSWKEAA